MLIGTLQERCPLNEWLGVCRRGVSVPARTGSVQTGPAQEVDHAAVTTGQLHAASACTMGLGDSRNIDVQCTLRMDQETLLQCYINGFRAMGGFPEKVLHVRMKTALLHEDANGLKRWHLRFLDFAHYDGIQLKLCVPNRSQAKGKVTNGAKYVKGNFGCGRRIRVYEPGRRILVHLRVGEFLTEHERAGARAGHE